MNSLVVTCVLLVFGYANSQQIHGQDLNVLIANAFREIDVNHDHIFEMNEMQALIKANDDNGDGLLQCTEYYNHTSTPKTLAKQIFPNFDPNGDCTMSNQEVTALMARMDQSGDGKVTEHEFEHFYAQLIKHLGHTDHGHTGGQVVG